MRILFFIIALVLGQGAIAEILVPTRTIRAKEIISIEDLTLKNGDASGAITRLEDVVGMEARVSLYAGRPMRAGDIGPPALIDRNQVVSIKFSKGGLSIATEGRALDRAAVGETVRVMNLASRTTLTGVVMKNGTIEVK